MVCWVIETKTTGEKRKMIFQTKENLSLPNVKTNAQSATVTIQAQIKIHKNSNKAGPPF
jgi:hypothetical protein